MSFISQFWKGKNVFLTGHTGFKGSWLALWLLKLGARVHGYSLNPPTNPNMFDVANIKHDLSSHIISDIRDLDRLKTAVSEASPDIVIHMAAQPIVRDSYQIPVDTYTTNVIGTINILEAVRIVDCVKAIVCVTTDKCYENKEWVWGYRENEPLGGHDPYSSSKACAEIAVSSWRRSFFGTDDQFHHAAIATARAGNVIGGGDWAKDRLVPDCINAIIKGEKIIVRSPYSIRPWQHVLEPLSGYLILALKLYEEGYKYAEAWNFGPNSNDERPVEYVVSEVCKAYGDGAKFEIVHNPDQPHEAAYLKLDCSKSRSVLAWEPKWNLNKAIEATVEWVKAWRNNADMRKLSESQIESYINTTSS